MDVVLKGPFWDRHEDVWLRLKNFKRNIYEKQYF